MSNKFNKKIMKIKSKKYDYSEVEKLSKFLDLHGGSNHSISDKEIDTLVKDLRYKESIGEITGLVIKDTPKQLYIMWDDDSLGAPLIIKRKKIKVVLDTPEKLVEHYKEAEKINIKTILKELKRKPLEVFFMAKGGFKYKEEGYEMIWYNFMDKNGKVYTIKMREINHLEFDDKIKILDNVKISMVKDHIGIKWGKDEKGK